MVCSPFFSHRLSKGYSNPITQIVSHANGVPVRNLGHLVELLRDTKEPFTVFSFAGRAGETLVFPHKECVAATEEILTDNGIRAQASPDLLKIWTRP